MESKEITKRLRSKRAQRDSVEATARNPLSQLLKALLAFLLPIGGLYFGNEYFSKMSADAFCQRFLNEINAGGYEALYKEFTTEDFRSNESQETFVTRTNWITRSFGKPMSVRIVLFEAKLIGGTALLQYDTHFEKQNARVTFFLVREKLSSWKVVRFLVKTE